MTAALFELKGKRIYVAGHTGMAGSAIVRRLGETCRILTVEHRELDLTQQEATERWLAAARPDVVVVAAGRVGGILANNNYPVDFLADNLAIALNLIRASHLVRVKKLLFLALNCVRHIFANTDVISFP
jgi:GDP-L-fucose synthase